MLLPGWKDFSAVTHIHTHRSPHLCGVPRHPQLGRLQTRSRLCLALSQKVLSQVSDNGSTHLCTAHPPLVRQRKDAQVRDLTLTKLENEVDSWEGVGGRGLLLPTQGRGQEDVSDAADVQ